MAVKCSSADQLVTSSQKVSEPVVRGHFIGSSRVRSVIILQEKAQEREKLLLKFMKIMKVKLAAD